MNKYWTEKELGLLEQAKTFHELSKIALVILARMKRQDKPIAQICGPMSTGGFNDFAKNTILFECAISMATERGLLIFDQIPFQEALLRIANCKSDQSYCAEILEIFYRKIFKSGYVASTLFLPDWQNSRGAVWERKFAIELGISVIDYPYEWLAESWARFVLFIMINLSICKG